MAERTEVRTTEEEKRAAPKAIFPTFFMTGFECSTFLWKDRQRKDYVSMTAHDRFLEHDYAGVDRLGFKVVREAIQWPLVDLGNAGYDFSRTERILAALERHGLTPVWDLFHYGLPDGCDPFSDECRERFVAFCRAVAELVVPRTPEPRFFTPINEITFFSDAATEMGWMYPFAKGRCDELKRALCRMSIDAVKAIREVDPKARMVHVDPIIYVIPPGERPDMADQAWKQTYDVAYEAWDMLSGRLHPELGGAPDILDIVGVNIYAFNQAVMKADGARDALGPRDPRREPLSELLVYAWERYGRPIVIGETSGSQDGRAEWLRMTMEESLKALNSGVDLQGVCLYPFVDIPDWNSGKLAEIGIFDLEDQGGCKRVPCDPYIGELRRWQKLLNQFERVDDQFDVDRDGVRLDEVKVHARRWEETTPGAQSVDASAHVAQAP
jgi:beta-glucosidase/6-phospho-beta-glucosidase/beta-galactosidase